MDNTFQLTSYRVSKESIQVQISHKDMVFPVYFNVIISDSILEDDK